MSIFRPNKAVVFFDQLLGAAHPVNSCLLEFETVTVIDQMILTSRQINFKILRNNTRKIGLNTTANKFYHINNMIGLDRLNLKFVHFKKLMKI